MVSTSLRSVLVTLLLCSSSVFANPVKSRTPYALKERHNVPRKWVRRGPAPSQHMINLQIGLKQGQFSELEHHLYEVSDPSHERYGQHLSAAEVASLVQPSAETASQVLEWLQDNGVEESQLQYSNAKDWIKVALPVAAVERLLDTKYSIYEHEDGTNLVRTPDWSLPKHLMEHVDTIQPTNSFFRPVPKRSTVLTVPIEDAGMDLELLPGVDKATVAEACNVTAVTPQCLRTLYGTAEYVPRSAGKNQIGLTNYLGEANNRSDIRIFLERFRPEAAAFNFTVKIIANGDDQQTPNNASQISAGKDLEGNLDAETIIGITPPFMPDLATPADTNEPYLDWVQFILNETAIPQVISTSYGDDEQTVPKSFAVSVCNQFAQLGARGVTLLFSSGDNGVGSNGACISNDGRNTSTFLPSFPASCPFVTTVGGTKNVNPEVAAFDAANGYSTGGGFSNYFARPSYQDAVVPAYVTGLGTMFDGLYNKSGRAYPDISAQGFRFVTIWNGGVQSLDGTSASSPAAASILSLVNDALLAAGKPVLGFLNPWLYSEGFKAFTDVTTGSTMGCDGAGFPAKAGWDPVTGFGTPFFPKIQAAALANGMFRKP